MNESSGTTRDSVDEFDEYPQNWRYKSYERKGRLSASPFYSPQGSVFVPVDLDYGIL